MKLREGNVFSLLAFLFSGQGLTVQNVFEPGIPFQTCSNLFYLDLTIQGSLPLDMFKLLHYKARTIGKRVGGIQLECFLVVEVDRRLGNCLADQILHIYSGDQILRHVIS